MENIESWVSETIFPGQRYGRYIVLSTHRRIGTYSYYAKCQCDCGSESRYVTTSCLRNETAQSCGCLHKERVTKHGHWGHPIFTVWSGMMQRCYKKNNKRYARYGGRGIKVCDRWHDVSNFISDMNDKFKPGLTIDRINNDKGYSPKNCRWATRSEQARNYSRNVLLTYNGETLCLADWSIKIGIPYKVLHDRVSRGWSVEDTLTKKVMTTKESSAIARHTRWNTNQS